jgi:hypothetical protein
MTNIQNILFVSDKVDFFENINGAIKSNTRVLQIGVNDKYNDISNNILSNINTNTDPVNIGFLYHNQTFGYLPFFRDEVDTTQDICNNLIFNNSNITIDDISNNIQQSVSYSKEMISNSVKQLISDVKNIASVNTVNIDIITCRNDQRSLTYLQTIQSDLNCNIYQTDNSIGYDGIDTIDIVKKVDNTTIRRNILDIYFNSNPFTSSGNNTLLLLGPGDLTFNGTNTNVFTLNQTYIDTNINNIRTSGIDLGNSVINITEDITIPNDLRIVIDNSGNNKVVINGNNHKITVTNYNGTGEYDGLLFLEDGAKIQINDLEVDLSNCVIIMDGSPFIKPNFDSVIRTHSIIEVNNCKNNNDLPNRNCGGIIGYSSGYQGNTTIKNCYNTGVLSGFNCSGMSGRKACGYGTLLVENCYNTGNMVQFGGGGIIGRSNGLNCVSVIVRNCYNTGNMSADACGGITAQEIGVYGQGTVLIENCYNTGDLNGTLCSGIVCGRTSTFGNIITKNCYNTGNISGKFSGGIHGASVGQSGVSYIENCYNIGNISDNYTGGILGHSCGIYGDLTIKNCYNTGNLSGTYSGGVGGGQVSQSGSLLMEYCYNTGNVNGNYSGGLLGGYICADSPNDKLCIIKQCYNTGNLTGYGSGGICGAELGYDGEVQCIIRDCYSSGSIDVSGCGGILGAQFANEYIRQDISFNLTIENCYTTYKTFTEKSAGIIGNFINEPSYLNLTSRNNFTYDNGKLDIYGNLVGGNYNTSLLENGRLDARLNTNKSYINDNYGYIEYPLLKVFRDDITWNSDKYINYNMGAQFGVAVIVNDLYKQKVLKMQTTNISGLFMNNLLYRRVLYQNITKKYNSNNDNTYNTRLMKLKYKTVYNKQGK